LHDPKEIVASFILHNMMRPNGVVNMSNDFSPVVVCAIPIQDRLLNRWMQSSKYNPELLSTPAFMPQIMKANRIRQGTT